MEISITEVDTHLRMDYHPAVSLVFDDDAKIVDGVRRNIIINGRLLASEIPIPNVQARSLYQCGVQVEGVADSVGKVELLEMGETCFSACDWTRRSDGRRR